MTVYKRVFIVSIEDLELILGVIFDASFMILHCHERSHMANTLMLKTQYA